MLVLSHSESKLCSFYFVDYVRKIMTKFENYSQPDEPVGKPDQLVH